MQKEKKAKIIYETVEEIKKLIALVNNEEKEKELNNKLDNIVGVNIENYSDGYLFFTLRRLNALKKELFSYFNFIKSNTLFDRECKRLITGSIYKGVVNDITDIAIGIFKQIENEKIDKIDIAQDLMNNFCVKLYRIMKCELLFSYDSIIYNYVKDNSYLKSIFEKLITNDFETLKNKVLNGRYFRYNKKIEKQILFYESLLDTDIFNIDIIHFLSIEDDFNLRYIKWAQHLVYATSTYIEFINKSYTESYKYYFDDDNRISEALKKYRKSRNELKVRLCSIGISLGMIATTMFGLSSSIKDSCISKVYNGTSTKYSTIDKKETTSSFKVDVDDSSIDDSIKVNLYTKAYNNGKKDVRTLFSYDVSDYTYSNLKDYLNIDLSKLDYDIRQVDYDASITSSQYLEVINTKIDKSNIIETIDKSYHIIYIITLLLCEFALDLLSLRSTYTKKKNKVDLGLIVNLLDIFLSDNIFSKSLYRRLKDDKEKVKKLIDYKEHCYKRMKELLDELDKEELEFAGLIESEVFVLDKKYLDALSRKCEENCKKVRTLAKQIK